MAEAPATVTVRAAYHPALTILPLAVLVASIGSLPFLLQPVWLLTAPLVFGGGALYAQRQIRRLVFEVELSGDGARFTEAGMAPIFVRWEDVLSFDDGAAERVALVFRRPFHAAHDMAIPTRTEADRVAVLGFLAQRGVVRHDR